MYGGARRMHVQSTRVHQNNALGWLAGARAGGFQPVILWGNVGNHARAAFSLRPTGSYWDFTYMRAPDECMVSDLFFFD